MGIPVLITQSVSVDRRRALAGLCLTLTGVLTIYAGFSPDITSVKSFWPSGALAFFAAILLLPDTDRAQYIQLGVLIGVGLVLLLIGWQNGAVIRWPEVLSQNTALLTMVLSVGILKLVITDEINVREKLPVGRQAFLQTLLSVSLFGSVINISTPILIADRLSLNRPMDYFTAGTIVRMFSSCATWSPFFAGTAVVLTAVGNVSLLNLMVSGLPLLLAAILILYFGSLMFSKEKVERFHGYPIKVESLRLPVLLALMVFLSYWLLPSLSILIVIALSSILLTVVIMSFKKGVASAGTHLLSYSRVDLPRSVSEVQLFLAAGVLASGLQSLVQIGWLQSPVDEFTGLTACLLLASMIVIAGLGIHPIIQIVAFAPLVLSSNPDPDLLGITFMFGWALGTCGSPLSGTNLVMQGRFGIVAWRGAVQNWPFIAVMYVVACFILSIKATLS